MKILSTNLTPTIEIQNKRISHPVFDTPKDTFVKSPVAFKGAEQKAAAQGAKTLLELGTFTAVVFAAFKKLTGGNDDIKDADIDITNNSFLDYFNKIVGLKDEKIKELEEENTKLKQENDELKSKHETIKSDSEEKTEDELPKEQTESNIEQEEVQFVKFPPKRGLLSAEQRTLKDIVTKLNISPEYNEKLTAICSDIIKKGSKDPENKTRTINLASELEGCTGDIEKLKSVIDKYDVNKENKAAEETEIPEQPNEETDSAEQYDEVYDPVSKRKLTGPKTVGTIDLSQIKERKKTRPRIFTNGDTVALTANGEVLKEGANPLGAASLDSAKIVPSSETSGIYTFSLPGTVHAGTKVYLTKALELFEKQYLAEVRKEAKEKGIKAEYVQWMYRRPTGFVSRNDVLNEVEKCKTHGIRSKYNIITRTTAESVADAINEDSRFRELFTFHAATKFIDRLVDFNSEEPIEDQVHNALDVLENILQLAFKNGVDMEEHDDIFFSKNMDKKESVDIYKGTNITIPTECYTEEARKIFGSYPLKLGICRSGKSEHKAVICTIYPKGVY